AARQLGPAAVAIPGDVADPAHRRALVDAAGPRLDLLVNNASVLGPSPQPDLAAYPPADLERVYAGTVLAPLGLHQPALARAAARGDGRIAHVRFRDLPDVLATGDLVVVNTSATLPAALAARREDGTPLELHVATEAPHAPGGDWWVVELRSSGGGAPFRGARGGERLELAGGDAHVDLVVPYAGGTRLWLARVDAP